MEKYDLCKDLKEEIQNFIHMIDVNKDLENINDIRGMTKRIIFLKTITLNQANNHYPKCMVYDLLSIVHALTQSSTRNVYNLYRSFIENFIRVVLELDDNDNTGVRNLFTSLKNKFSISPETIEIINYIEGEYSLCCNFVHSNVQARLSVFEYYKDILESDEMNSKKLTQIIKKILKFLQKATLFLIYISPESLDGAFHRNKQKMKFLIGDKDYSVFQRISS